jgi:hypothetical protein
MQLTCLVFFDAYEVWNSWREIDVPLFYGIEPKCSTLQLKVYRSAKRLFRRQFALDFGADINGYLAAWVR